MQSFKKKKNFQTEEHFHDEWAKSISVNNIDVIAQFESITSPEYKKAFESLGNIKNKKVLNLGCGLGEEATYLALKGAKVTAIDISQEMLNKTKELAKKYEVRSKIKFYKTAAEKLKFKDNTFDAVLGCNILHHVQIEDSIKEVKRVLKPNGIASFTEPLIYNPVINIYRAMASKVRTDTEHPLSINDIKLIKKVFPKTKHYEFHLSTLLIFVWFYVAEGLHPNKVRYWKKIITDGEKYKIPFRILQSIDNKLINLFPFVKRYCWETVIVLKK